MQTKNSALWGAIGEYAETHHEFMSAPTQALDKAIRAGESLYIAHEAARANLEALIGKRNENDAAPAVKHEASELPPLPEEYLWLNNTHLYTKKQMRAYGQACIDSRSPVAAAPSDAALYAACQKLVKYCDDNPPMGESLWCLQDIRAALSAAAPSADAKGEA